MKGMEGTRLLVFPVGLVLAVTALYWTSLDNALVFDDERLRDGTIFGHYGRLGQLKARLLSYGSFVWVQELFGEGWGKQRAVNVLLHLCTAFAVYRLLQVLFARTEFPSPVRELAHFEASRTLALRIGVALFALNPVAVYAVAYLVQRSILMAAMFVALGCLTFVQGLVAGRKAWIVVAFACYLLAVLSKEHAVTAIALAVPLFIFVQRPKPRRLLAVAVASAVTLMGVTAVLYRFYGSAVGAPFDETSRDFVLELELLRPGVGDRVYLLSMVNQATLFFQYGFFWLVPDVTRLSIDMRPEFPLAVLGWPQTAALAGYVAVLCGSAWLVVRRSDALGLTGLCLLFPSLLFVTEFATVWVQDPFVLYRSYLWALTMPALVALPLVGVKQNVLYALGAGLGCVFAALAFERVLSLRDAQSAWADAAAKIDMRAGANAVGRWRPLLNLGAEYLGKGAYETAHRHFEQAEALGEPLGSARFNMGVSRQLTNRHAIALEEFRRAEAKGFTEAALYYHRGESQFALKQYAAAFGSFAVALSKPQVASAEQHTRLRRAEAAVAGEDFDTAIADYRRLLGSDPDNARYLVGLAMAHIGRRDIAEARSILDPLIEKQPGGQAYFARALAAYYAGNRSASRQDLGRALLADPNNRQYLGFLDRLESERVAAAGGEQRK